MKKILLFLLPVLIFFSQVSKASTDVDTGIVVSSAHHLLSICVPDGYDPGTDYPLLVAIHYCGGGGNGTNYREALRPLCDSLNVIIACPDNNEQSMTDPGFITVTIDSIKNMFSIDEEAVFLTGMSCNGFEALQKGLNAVYPFKGIFPWVPWVESFTSTTFNLDSDIPVIIAVGTLDNNYNTLLKLYDSLEAHEAAVNLVLVKGIGHVLDFGNFDEEMIRCMHYLNDTNAFEVDEVEDITMYNNETNVQIPVTVTNPGGRQLYYRTLSSRSNTLPEPGIYTTGDPDSVVLICDPVAGKSGLVYIVLEVTEEGASGIDQVVFHVNVQNAPVSGIPSGEPEMEMKLFPVPADESIFIKCNENNLSLRVMDMQGRTVLMKDHFNTPSALDVSMLPKGAYLLKAKNENFEKSLKFIID